jgi:hypothetical protein
VKLKEIVIILLEILDSENFEEKEKGSRRWKFQIVHFEKSRKRCNWLK